jgi:flagellar biosynthesis protein FlhA
VIEAFGHFLIGGNYTVGIVVFVILTIINFTVVTKGAGRIAEVGARFALDAMPGKQMAIDADLNAGMIAEPEARKRRTEVAQEAEFYGAMDGASKYVQGRRRGRHHGHLINVIGGLIVGVVQHDMSAGDAAKTYTLLAIGDGLVAQIPSLIISIAAGMVVSRVANEQDIGGQMIGQLFAKPEVLYITGGIIAGMGLIPGMPNLVFLLLGGVLGGSGYLLAKRAQCAGARSRRRPPARRHRAPSAAARRNRRSDLAGHHAGRHAGPGSGLPPDSAGRQDPGRRAAQAHQGHPQEIRPGSGLPGAAGAHPRQPGTEAIELPHHAQGRGSGQGEAINGQFLAINPGMASGTLPGQATTDPAFGLPAVWIEPACATKRRTWAIPWSTPAPWWPPT